MNDFGKLAGGVLLECEKSVMMEMDAVGELAISNAVKAVALANTFNKSLPQGITFVPLMTTDENGSKLLRLIVHRRAADTGDPPKDFSQGGIYVPVDAKTAGRRGRGSTAAQTKDTKADAEAGAASIKVATPTDLAKTVLGQWTRFAAPELRAAARAAAMDRARGGPGTATASAADVPRRGEVPFLLTMGPPALCRAVKALAFVCADLHKDAEHLVGIPALTVVPQFWEKQTVDRRTEEEKTQRAVVLWLAYRVSPLQTK